MSREWSHALMRRKALGMTLEEWMEGIGPKEGMRYWRDGMYVLADALRADGWRIVKLEDHGTKYAQDLKVVEELS